MAPGIANTLDILVHQQEAQALTIRNLIALCRAHGLPELKLASALLPLVDASPLAQELGPGHTEPMEVDEIRKADPPDTFQGAPTQELPTVAVEDAGDVS
jgi:hypothetical protein